MAHPVYGVPASSVADVPAGSCCMFDVARVNNANFIVGTTNTMVSMRGLTADRTVTLPPIPQLGQTVIVKDEDGSLAGFNIIIDGNGNTIDGAATYTMTLVQDGLRGSITVVYQGAGWSIV